MKRYIVLLVLVACSRKHGDAYKIEQLSAQGARACATMKDGAARCWGRSGNAPDLRPTLVDGFHDAAQTCVGEGFVCVRSRAGKLTCEGSPLSAEGVTDVACGAKHACIIAGNHVRCGTSAFTDVPDTTGAVSVAAGGDTSCAVFPHGTAKCWGRGQEGQLGDGRQDDRDTPSRVLVQNVRSIAVGAEHTCALLRDETAVCFGSNDDGQLGTGDTRGSAVPRQVEGVLIATELACGAHHTCARMGDSTVHCWGKNDVHQAGVVAVPHLLTHTLVSGLYEAESVAAGDDFTCVRMKDDWVRCFGVNDWGQLADGTTELRNVPTPIRY